MNANGNDMTILGVVIRHMMLMVKLVRPTKVGQSSVSNI